MTPRLLEFRHREGELLKARDLNAELAADAFRWALHLRAVHRTWGVALGFAVESLDSQGAVAVGPGLGYDCRGMEILSARPLLIPQPVRLSPADLTVSAGECGPRLRWREPGRACDDELLLARGYFKAGKTIEIDGSVRKWCRSPSFRLAAGIAEHQLKAKINVSTAAGGFTDTPFYFATLELEARLTATLEVTKEKAESFQLVLRASDKQLRDSLKEKPNARVHWVGVERRASCDIEEST
jgi:hypothetical protein